MAERRYATRGESDCMGRNRKVDTTNMVVVKVCSCGVSYDQTLVPDFRKMEAPGVARDVSLSSHLLRVLLHWLLLCPSALPEFGSMTLTMGGLHTYIHCRWEHGYCQIVAGISLPLSGFQAIKKL